MVVQERKDTQTVTPEGERVMDIIDGVKVRNAVTHADERGTLTEVYDPRWGIDDQPVVYMTDVTINPGAAKGWIKHERQVDRLYFRSGSCKVVLYDDRSGSPTYGMINEVVFTDNNRGLIIIPPGVWHGLVNVSNTVVMYCNVPSTAYNHANPDKIRLPIENDYIPYDLSLRRNW